MIPLTSLRRPRQQPQRSLTVGMGMLLSLGIQPMDCLVAEEPPVHLPPPAWLRQDVPPLGLQSGYSAASPANNPLLPEGGGFSVMEPSRLFELQSTVAQNTASGFIDRPPQETTTYQSPYYQAALSSGELGFSPPPTLVKPDWKTFDSDAAAYDSRADVPTERPWIEWGRPFYGSGMIPPGGTFFGPFNLLHPTFYVYGDFRLGASTGQNALGRIDNVATRLNLEMDLAITATERFHALISPLNQAGDVTHIRFDDDRLVPNSAFNADFVTGFFEGDLGYMIGGVTDTPAEFELPIALGLLPLLYQNGIWMDDAVTGVAISRNARHSRALNWSNYDASIFAIVDQINSPAFGADANAAQAIGTAWFIEAYGGYIESGWAYVHDRKDQGRSYHNWTVSFTRRYFDRIGNSVRLIVNSGQDLQQTNQTADGCLLIIENNWITAQAMTFVPYWNVFYGWGRPQSIARNAIAGGILRNVGINFETDALNGYPTLDDTGHNTAGGAVGVNLLGSSLERQVILEASMVQSHDFDNRQRLPGNEYGLGMRYQVPLSNCTLLRFDTMYGWREHREDVFGARAEFRYKF